MAFLVTAFLACSTGDRPLPKGSVEQPDVVLISVDTLRADHLSSYGYERETSPFFDKLAASGVQFNHARSGSPWTLPAHLTLLSGQLTQSHQVVDDNLKLEDDVPVLADWFSQQGWATGGFVATLYVSRLFGFERGFDRFDDFGIHTEKANLQGEVTAEDVVDSALKWWSSLPDGKPAFLFLHVYDVHYTYDPPAPYDTLFDQAPERDDPRYKNYFYFQKKKNRLSPEQFAHQIAQYDESIRYVNDQFERLQAAANASGRNVRWVVTADHGEEFGERGTWGHAHTLYAEQLHVPLIMSGDGLPNGQQVDDEVGNHDVAPTIMRWVEGAEPFETDGVDLNPLLAGENLDTRPFPAETTRFETNRVGLYEDGLRLEWDLKRRKVQLYATREDPKESKNLAKQRPEDVKRLQARLEEVLGKPWEARLEGTVTTTGVVLADGRHAELRVAPGDRFLVLPYDAEVRFVPTSGEAQGPWAAVGGEQPAENAGLSYHGQSSVTGLELDEATRRSLEALGYMQAEE